MFAAINYHYIRESFDAPYPSIFGKTPKEFSQQLDVLGRVGSFVHPSQIKDAIEGKIDLPPKSILITFDDGLKEQFELALPILDAKGIPAIFYINTSNHLENDIQYVHLLHILRSKINPELIIEYLQKAFNLNNQPIMSSSEVDAAIFHYKYDNKVNAILKYFINFKIKQNTAKELLSSLFDEHFRDEKLNIKKKLYMNDNEIEILSSRGYLGSHGHHHYPLGTLDDFQKMQEVQLSQSFIKSCTKKDVVSFSYPYGSKLAVKGCEEVLKENGFLFSFTMERAINKDLQKPLFLARLDNNDVPMGKAYKFKTNNFFETYKSREWYL